MRRRPLNLLWKDILVFDEKNCFSMRRPSSRLQEKLLVVYTKTIWSSRNRPPDLLWENALVIYEKTFVLSIERPLGFIKRFFRPSLKERRTYCTKQLLVLYEKTFWLLWRIVFLVSSSDLYGKYYYWLSIRTLSIPSDFWKEVKKITSKIF